MMRIELDLPDWVETEKRRIHILAGVEQVAYKTHGQPWKVKVTRCNRCGLCCMNAPANFAFGRNEETGHCAHLEWKGEWRCDLGVGRPHKCCVNDASEHDWCSIEWAEVT